MAMTVGGIISRFSRQGNNAGGPVPHRLTGLMSLATTDVEPQGCEMLRAGRRFAAGHINGATFQAQQTAVPTTTAGFLLYNAETAASGKSYVIDGVSAYLAGGTAGTGMVLFGAVLPAGSGFFTVPTTVAAGTGIANLSGKASALSNAKTALAAAVVQSANVWNWAVLNAGNAGALMAGVAPGAYAAQLLVPPGAALALAVVSAAGTAPTFGLSCTWVELELDVE